jgi:hypothetical protein
MNILCVTRFFKGTDLLSAIKEEGHHAFLLTSTHLKNESWPWEAITDTYYMPEDEQGEWNMPNLLKGLAYTMKTLKFDILVALDDFDVENTAAIREHFRIPGMGQTTARYFRDKLAMRMKAADAGINIPAFSSLFNDEDIHKFTNSVSAPWLVKPRSQASAAGIKKINNTEELWQVLHTLGDERHHYLIEKFAPGDVYHVDALTYDGKVVFARSSKYMATPFEVAHGGGIFRSHTIEQGSEDDKALIKMNADIMKSFGMQYSASHTEFIKSKESGEIYFLETSSRVGGANLAEMVEIASGVNLWKEWCKIEIAAHTGGKYKVPKDKNGLAGIIVSLSKYEYPDLSKFNHADIAWRMHKKHHVGLIFNSKKMTSLITALNEHAEIIKEEYHASMPATDRALN